jgi:hypothetical protein
MKLRSGLLRLLKRLNMKLWQIIDDANYTSKVFENDILTGWGYTHLDRVRKQQNLKMTKS